MKKSLFILAAIFSFFQSSATNLQGVINGNVTWTKAASPYDVVGHLLIDSLAVVTIEPGVEVRVAKGVNFFIDGELDAIGTPTELIRFTSLVSGERWNGMNFRESNHDDSTIFMYCKIEKAIIAVELKKRDLRVEHCVFDSVYIDAIRHTWGKSLFVADNSFYNAGCGIYTGGSNGAILNNLFQGKTRGIDIGGSSTLTIANNIFKNHTGQGIWAHAGVLDINNNTFLNNGTGIEFQNGIGQSDISDNVFAFHRYGIMISKGFPAVFSHNTIKYNNVGVYISNFHAGAKFEYNCFVGDTLYDVQLHSSYYSLDFRNNYWDIKDSADLQSRIVDFYDDFVQAKVQYIPFLTAPDSSCQNVTQPPATAVPNTKAKTSAASVYPNPFHSSFELKMDTDVKALIISDLVGKMVLTMPVNGKKNITVDMQAYPAGVYIYQVAAGDGTVHTGKIMKQ